ncbi:hypothetical protein F5X96DRAFT_681907 [Biscogniauxia mediterranea]|nr:hypothetical protein F5X96DRAFT_681907 [Biscogniauxia mediterranea]
MSATLVACLVAVCTRTTQAVLFFYDGDCEGGHVGELNLALHLLINILSTLVAVLASSNFFMQVLNSPTREEVNAAHFSGSWLGIGIPSVRNAFRVSKFKTCCWVVLLLSSIPIHLAFNSTIFETDHRGSDYHLTIATENFTRGGAYYPPGGSLTIPGIVSEDAGPEAMRPWSYRLDSSYFNRFNYGASVNISDYDNKESPVVSNVSAVATNAGKWERIEVNNCLAQYYDCSGLKKYRDVVLVTENADGWIRDNIWHLMDNETAFWDRYVPADSANSLFFDAQCAMVAQYTNDQGTLCSNDCIYALGGRVRRADYYNDGWAYPFFAPDDTTTLDVVNRSLVETPGQQRPVDNLYNMTTSGLQPGTYNVSVSYCLVEPMENICHIAISPVLLASVTACVIAKTVAAVVVTVVLGRRNQDPLVTLGDAVASFIERPDRVTAGLCTVGQADIRRAMRSRRAFVLPGPRPWRTPPSRRRAAAVPAPVWLTSYLLFAAGIAICAGLFHSAFDTNGLTGGFLEGDGNSFIPLPFTLTQAVLLANSPQLLLSFCYLAYNNLFTRLQMAREWALFSDGYHPLRVTNPKLPYKYSIPLIAVSIFLHWLLSNTIYVFVSIGGYYGTDNFLASVTPDPSLPANTAVAVGYSTPSLLTLMAVSVALICVPALLGLKRLPPNITNPGSNSLALSAACHCSSLSYAAVAVAGKAKLLDSPMRTSPAPSFFAPHPRPTPEYYIPVGSGNPEEEEEEEGFARNYHQQQQQRHALDNRNNDAFEMRTLTGSNSNSSRHYSSSSSSTTSRHQDDYEDEDNAGKNEGTTFAFSRLAQSEIRWGVVRMPPEWHAEYDNGDGDEEGGPVVGHLGFGVEEDGVGDPAVGRAYA